MLLPVHYAAFLPLAKYDANSCTHIQKRLKIDSGLVSPLLKNSKNNREVVISNRADKI